MHTHTHTQKFKGIRENSPNEPSSFSLFLKLINCEKEAKELQSQKEASKSHHERSFCETL